MSLRDLFLMFSKNDCEKELKEKITALEINLEELKNTFILMQNEEQQNTSKLEKDPPIIIERINIEKIIFDKYELNNNLGQLGIKELKGKLNIGATYGSDSIPKPNFDGNKRSPHQNKMEKTKGESGPKVNIVSKKEM
jgi:hypothetical protein